MMIITMPAQTVRTAGGVGILQSAYTEFRFDIYILKTLM